MEHLYSVNVASDLSIAHVHYADAGACKPFYAKRVVELALIECNIPYKATMHTDSAFRIDFVEPFTTLMSVFVSISPTSSENEVVKIMDNVFGTSYSVRVNTMSLYGKVEHAYKAYVHTPTTFYDLTLETSAVDMMKVIRQAQARELGDFIAQLCSSQNLPSTETSKN